jgi:hypothetical protein
MQIDHNERGNPHAMLVSVSPAPAPDPDGRYFTVFIPIDEILKLRHTDKTLAGHPWLDVPQDEIIGFSISRSDHNFILRHLKNDRYIAIRAVGQRGRRSKGCYLDNQGQPLVQYRFGWRRIEKYVTDPIDRMWLEEFSKESARYADKIFLIEAIAEYFQRLAKRVAVMPKPRPTKKKRLKAKERRRMAKSYD